MASRRSRRSSTARRASLSCACSEAAEADALPGGAVHPLPGSTEEVESPQALLTQPPWRAAPMTALTRPGNVPVAAAGTMSSAPSNCASGAGVEHSSARPPALEGLRDPTPPLLREAGRGRGRSSKASKQEGGLFVPLPVDTADGPDCPCPAADQPNGEKAREGTGLAVNVGVHQPLPAAAAAADTTGEALFLPSVRLGLRPS
mmetsp:Transcript_88303/g.146193  ORF Transcript_88303/g.146193 Transcript_88303/m.146193 type:complete len:203 (+) Transcript_88303:80-688(+)